MTNNSNAFTKALARSIERQTGVWFGPMALVNGFWHTLRVVDSITINWSQQRGLSWRGCVLGNIANGLNTQCTEPIITAEIVALAIGDALRVCQGLKGGAVMVWCEGTQISFATLPFEVETGRQLWMN